MLLSFFIGRARGRAASADAAAGDAVAAAATGVATFLVPAIVENQETRDAWTTRVHCSGAIAPLCNSQLVVGSCRLKLSTVVTLSTAVTGGCPL